MQAHMHVSVHAAVVARAYDACGVHLGGGGEHERGHFEAQRVQRAARVLAYDRRGRLLLIREAAGWCLPGGKEELRDGGSLVATAIREFLEETGLMGHCGNCIKLSTM